MEVTVTFSDMPCIDQSPSPNGALCGAFQQFIEAELAAYSPRATDPDELQKECAMFIEGLHDKFMDADLCLLARAMRAKMNDETSGLDVTAGQYGQCPPLVGERTGTKTRGHLRLVTDPVAD